MNNQILNEVDKIVNYIKDKDDYKDYLFLKEKLANNDKATKLIKEVKHLQQEIVKLEIEKKDIKFMEDKINKNLQELKRMPLYVEFIEKQEKLDNIYQTIKEKLDDYFNKKFN